MGATDHSPHARADEPGAGQRDALAPRRLACASRPILTSGSPELPRLPWGLGQGDVWVEGTFWLGVGTPKRESGPQGISETGRSSNLVAGNEEQLFWRKEALGMETP